MFIGIGEISTQAGRKEGTLAAATCLSRWSVALCSRAHDRSGSVVQNTAPSVGSASYAITSIRTHTTHAYAQRNRKAPLL